MFSNGSKQPTQDVLVRSRSKAAFFQYLPRLGVRYRLKTRHREDMKAEDKPYGKKLLAL